MDGLNMNRRMLRALSHWYLCVVLLLLIQLLIALVILRTTGKRIGTLP